MLQRLSRGAFTAALSIAACTAAAPAQAEDDANVALEEREDSDDDKRTAHGGTPWPPTRSGYRNGAGRLLRCCAQPLRTAGLAGAGATALRAAFFERAFERASSTTPSTVLQWMQQ